MASSDKSSASFFETKYQQTLDPWNFATSRYEQGRYGAILRALEPRRFHRAFEPGCSIGALTERLAGISDEVHASDFSDTAAARARERCKHLPGVSVQCDALTPDTPLQGYDLVVLSEIGYYFEPAVWPVAVARLAGSMDLDTTVLACHWLGHSEDHLQSGDQVHTVLEADPQLALEHTERHEGFRLARLRRR